MPVKFCPGCGKEVDGNPSFCVGCGLDLRPHYAGGGDTITSSTSRGLNTPQLQSSSPTIIIQQAPQRTTPRIAVVALIIAIINGLMMWVIPVLPVLVFVVTLTMTIIALAKDSTKYNKGLAIFLLIGHMFQAIIIIAYSHTLSNFYGYIINGLLEQSH